MKTKAKNKPTEKSLMEQLREIRDKISHDIKDMSNEQIKEYFNRKKTIHAVAWQKES